MKIRLLFLSLLCFCVTHAQGQDEECAAKAAKVEALVAANDFSGAFDAWQSARKCVSESLYRNGEKILINQLKTPLSDADRAAQNAMLLQLYSDYDRDFPMNSNSNAVKKAMYLYRQDKSQPEIFTLLDRAFTKDREHFTDANALQIYFDTYYKQVLAQTDQSMAPLNIIAKRNDVLERLGKLFADTQNKDYEMVSAGIRRLSAPMATCENLDKFHAKEIDF